MGESWHLAFTCLILIAAILMVPLLKRFMTFSRKHNFFNAHKRTIILKDSIMVDLNHRLVSFQWYDREYLMMIGQNTSTVIHTIAAHSEGESIQPLDTNSQFSVLNSTQL